VFPKHVLLSIHAFIRVFFWAFGKIFTAFTLQVYTHFFFQKLVMISESFFKEKLEVISLQKHVGFSARQFIFLFLFFSFSIKLLSFVYFFFQKRSGG